MEFGAASLRVLSATGVLAGLSPVEKIWMSHRDTVAEMPPGFERLGETDDCPVAAMGDPERRIWGMQFHPEVTHTVPGMRILDNFLDLCGCERTWTMENFIAESVASLRQRCAGRKLFLFVSGGVDSSVCFLLLNRALGSGRVLGLHIDNGFMRKNETATVAALMRESGFENLEVVDAGREFLAAVAGVSDPEVKRRRIGDEFIRTRDRALEELDLDPEEWLLGQGTLYTDRIESGGSAHAETIKTHHNRVPVVERLLAEGRIVEPLGDLYKDEVRELGEKLGLPRRLVWRHPFPGPGLAVRVLCSDGVEENEAASLQLPDEAAASAFGADRRPAAAAQRRGPGRRAQLRPPGADLRSRGRPGSDRLGPPGAAEHRADQHRPGGEPRRPAARSGEKTGSAPQGGVPDAGTARPAAGGGRDRHGGPGAPRADGRGDADAGGAGAALLGRAAREHRAAPGHHRRLHDRPLRPPAGSPSSPRSPGKLLALDGIEAVYYDITHKPPATVEWE